MDFNKSLRFKQIFSKKLKKNRIAPFINLGEFQMAIRILFMAAVLHLAASEERPKAIDTKKAQEFQADFDDRFFEINGGFEQVRHILLHLAKSTGKMATYCEAMEHGKKGDPSQIIDEVVPDLLMHALQLANLFRLDLSAKYEERVDFVIRRIIESSSNAH
jgi:hypothetical protein